MGSYSLYPTSDWLHLPLPWCLAWGCPSSQPFVATVPQPQDLSPVVQVGAALCHGAGSTTRPVLSVVLSEE